MKDSHFILRVRTHHLAQYFNCAEICYIKAYRLIPYMPFSRESIRGVQFHRRLSCRSYPPEVELLKHRLVDLEPLSIIHSGLEIFLHPDDYRVYKRKVSIVEEKTVGRNPDIYSFEPHRFQLEIYVFALSRLLPSIGFKIADIHYLRYWKRRKKSFKLFKVYRLKIDSDTLNEIGEKILQIAKMLKGKENPILPLRSKCWKCRIFKKKCRFYLRKLPISRKEWEARFT